MAIAVIDIARQRSLRVPEDLSVVGFDDNPVASTTAVPLTTIQQPLREMGAQGVQLLADTMDGKRKQPLKMRLPTRLIERQSCRQTWMPR